MEIKGHAASAFEGDSGLSRKFGGSVRRTYLSTPSVHHASFDVYYMGWDRQNAHFDKGTAHERRHTFGARLSQRGVWAYDAEAIFQLGTFGAGDIRAWRGVIEASRSISAPWTPRMGIDLDVASGDRARGSPTLGTFNA